MSNAPYSWRDDPTVPDFADTTPVVFMDGDCVLCSRGARLIARFDKKNEFRVCPIQSNLGTAILQHFDLEPEDPNSWLYLVNGQAFTSIDAMIRVGRRIGGPGYLMSTFRLVPPKAQEWFYQCLARNRYRWFGRADLCAIPDPELQKRLIG